jgi:hypothetical protein
MIGLPDKFYLMLGFVVAEVFATPAKICNAIFS